jgi:hypothetical protein
VGAFDFVGVHLAKHIHKAYAFLHHLQALGKTPQPCSCHTTSAGLIKSSALDAVKVACHQHLTICGDAWQQPQEKPYPLVSLYRRVHHQGRGRDTMDLKVYA